MPLVISFTCS